MRGMKIKKPEAPKRVKKNPLAELLKSGRIEKPRKITGERLVLLIGDEGAVMVHLARGKVVARTYSPAASAPETQNLTDMARRAPKAPFDVVFDTADQTYVQQGLPPVSSFSINKLIARRLKRDLPEDNIKGAIRLGRESGARKDWLFLMAALQPTHIVKEWLSVIEEWPNPCRGLFLLPLETTEVTRRLHAALRRAGKEGAEEKKAAWKILASYNKISGIRQMVFHDGKLVLTRLGQPALDSTAESLAGTIEQEIVGTKEYLKRLAFQEKDGLSILIIAADEIRGSIDAGRLRADQAQVITPHEAAEMLNLPGASQPTDRYGDSFLCAAIGSNRKSTLTLMIDELRKLQQLAKARLMLRAAAGVVVLGMAGSIGATLWEAWSVQSELGSMERQKKNKEQELEALKKKSTRKPEELERIAEAVKLYDALREEAPSPEPPLARLSAALNGKVMTSVFQWELKAPKPAAPGMPPPEGIGGMPPMGMPPEMGGPFGAPPAAPPKPRKDGPDAEMSVTVEFIGEGAYDRKSLQPLSDTLLAEVKAQFPDYDVQYTAIPPLISDNERIDVNLSQSQGSRSDDPKSRQAKMLLRGPADMGDTPAAPAAAKKDEKPKAGGGGNAAVQNPGG